jgi:hypothetical protein
MSSDPPREDAPDLPLAAPHFWQVPEAERELDRISPRLVVLREQVARLAQIQEERERLARLWGKEVDAVDHPDAARIRRLEREWQTLYRTVESDLERWRDRGIEVKDLNTGLVDFYALRKGEVILLCWKSDEDGIHHWHPLNGGFRGRRRLTETERKGGLDPDPRDRSSDEAP